VNVAALRGRVDALISHVPLLRNLATEIIRIEFIDRCMLIAAQALLAMVPMPGVILALSTWLIGFGGIVVGGALVGRLLVEDPVIARNVRRVRTVLTRSR
jgi:hypothetical protein